MPGNHRSVGGRARRRGTERAFTLIELTLVIVILALLSAISIPKFASTHRRMMLDQAARRLITTVQYARSQAVVFQQEVDMVFELDPPGYRLVMVGSQSIDSPSAFDLEDIRYQREGGYIDNPADAGSDPNMGQPNSAAFEPVITELENPLYFFEIETARDGPLQEGEGRVRFYPNGTLDPFLLVLEHPGWGSVQLEFDPMTGRAYSEVL
jgi:prepilin-type N-terminal cleavage/methylation domain-containing protein